MKLSKDCSAFAESAKKKIKYDTEMKSVRCKRRCNANVKKMNKNIRYVGRYIAQL